MLIIILILLLYLVGDGAHLRNFVLAHGALGPLLEVIQPGINVRKYLTIIFFKRTFFIVITTQKSYNTYSRNINNNFNKHRRPTKSVGYFAQRGRLLFPQNEETRERSFQTLLMQSATLF